MKFGRYLIDNATPEWHRAYIDYRALKKQIKRIVARQRHEEYDEDVRSSSNDEDHGPSARPRSKSSISIGTAQSSRSPATVATSAHNASEANSTKSPWRGPKSAKSPLSSTPGSLAKTPGSGSYGAMGTSPRLTEGDSRGLPPLDLGGPALPVPQDREHRAHRRLREGRGVDFSPVVQDIPDDDSRADDADEEGEGEEETSGNITGDTAVESEERAKPSQDGESTKSRRTRTKSTADSSEDPLPSISITPLSPPKPRLKRSGTIDSKATPKLLSRSPRAPPTAAVSPSNTADAPSGPRSLHSLRLPSPKLQPQPARTFEELYKSLEPDEKKFFDLLDEQLDKVETFYSNRETEAMGQYRNLRGQLQELANHRRIFHEQYPNGIPEWEAKVGRVLPGGQVNLPVFQAAAKKLHLRVPFTQSDGEPSKEQGKNGDGSRDGNGSGSASRSGNNTPGAGNGLDAARQYDPERYQKYKKDLRTATLEFYRHLELIKNYRILNLTGFRKALKKFEKATKIACLELYTDERISACSFARGEAIDSLLKKTEEMFTEHFEHGDVKRARTKLRAGDQPVTHYGTVMRSGLMIGLSLPAAVLALVKSFEEDTREAIPGYAALLQIYGTLYIPVIFGMLFELNLVAWVAARINYEFVMELSRPVLDYRSFLEMPAFFFMTLSYCFFFSFYQVSPENVAPTTWPLAWLVFICAFFLNPLPILRRRSRYWFLRVLFRVCTPGYSRVEFIAFFVADELNSLVYTIQNIYFIGCVYNVQWESPDAHCKQGGSWPYALLACLPPLSRLIQCLKRYKDSKLEIHLINAGKYCSSILTQCLFVYWRSRGSKFNDKSFIIWIIFATFSSIYTSTWDLVVDWSLLRPHVNLLRKDLGYGNVFVYYWAMVTNIIVRFIWVWYIPELKKYSRLRSFIFAIFEMLRRWQWNFFRVETEHLGNADAYRVTREIPLPYAVREQDSEDELSRIKTRDSGKGTRTLPFALVHKLQKFKSRVVGRSGGRGPDALNVGPRGHAAQREYESSRPGDSGALPRDSSDSAV